MCVCVFDGANQPPDDSELSYHNRSLALLDFVCVCMLLLDLNNCKILLHSEPVQKKDGAVKGKK